MAEFCRDCFYKLNPKEPFVPVLSAPWDKDLCENCGEWKQVVVDLRPPLFFDIFGEYGYKDREDDG